MYMIIFLIDNEPSQLVCDEVEQDDDSDAWMGYKIVGDNLDFNVKPRYRRIDTETQSLHFFHYYAVKDRINLAGVSDQNAYADVPSSSLPVDTLLPSSSDQQSILHNFGILVGRVLVEELPYFNSRL